MNIDFCARLEPGKSVPLSFAPGQFALSDRLYLCICACHTTNQKHRMVCCITAPCGAKVVAHCVELHKYNCENCGKILSERLFTSLSRHLKQLRIESET